MQVYLGNQKINRLYSGDKEMINPTTEASINFFIAEYLVVAEGGLGTGPNGFGAAAGGGGGGLLSGSMEFSYGTTYYVEVDTGGGDTAFRGMTAVAGGNGNNNGIGGAGGSGGGAAGGIFGASSFVAGQGNAGGGCNAANDAGGGGGGAGGAGGFGALNPGGGGQGKQSAITGTLTWYSGGGAGGDFSLGNWYYGGNGDGAAPNYGGGQRANPDVPAGEGICVIRYKGPQKATGGTITTDGDYIIHTFTKNIYVEQPFTTYPKAG